MFLHFKDKFPQLARHWEKYAAFQKRLEVPARTVLLEEGRHATNYIFVEKGCVRAFFNNKVMEKTVQFFFENEGLTSFDSFINDTPSLLTIDTIEASVIHLLPKKYVIQLFDELKAEPQFFDMMLKITSVRQLHYMNEFFSSIRDTPEERYRKLLAERPHIIRRVPQHYIASYLGITRVHLSRIKSALAKKK